MKTMREVCALPLALLFLMTILACGAVAIEDRPYQIIRPDASHVGLQIDDENLRIIEDIQDNIAIVGVVGAFHSGKSFLLNQMMRKPSGFRVGPTVAAETKGLWIWGHPLKETDPQTGKGLSILFLDTEGFYASNISESYDAKVFGVSTLISSYLIFNSVKIIDQNDIDYLEVLSKRTHLFSLKSQLSHHELEKDSTPYPDIISFPPLMWVVEDFFQDLGAQSATEWVKSLLNARSRDEQVLQSSLSSLFPSIEAHTLFLPSIYSKQLQNLNGIKQDELHPEYKTGIEELRQKVLTNVKPKKRGDNVMTGKELASLLRLLVDAANAGTFPNVPSVWTAFLETQMKSAQEDTLRVFMQETGKFTKEPVSTTTVMTSEELEEQIVSSKEKAEELFKQLLFGLHEVYSPGLQQLRDKMVDAIENHYRANNRRIEELCEGTVSDYVTSHQDKIDTIKLPQPSKLLNKLHAGAVDSVLREYEDHLAKFSKTDAFAKYHRELQSKISASLAHLTIANNEKLKAILSDAVGAATSLYKQMTNAVEDPLSYDEFMSAHNNASSDALNLYAAHAQAAKEESDYTPYLGHLKQLIDELRTEFNLKNDKRIEVIISQTRVNCWQTFTRDVSRQELPMDEVDLYATLKKSKEHALNTFTRSLEKFTRFDKFKNEYKIFEDQLVRRIAETLETNIKDTKTACVVPFLQAKHRIEKEAGDYFWAFALENRARIIAEEELVKSNKLKNAAFRAKVIDRFVAEDLHDLLQGLNTFSIMQYVGGGLVVVVGLVIFGMRATRKPTRPRRKLD